MRRCLEEALKKAKVEVFAEEIAALVNIDAIHKEYFSAICWGVAFALKQTPCIWDGEKGKYLYFAEITTPDNLLYYSDHDKEFRKWMENKATKEEIWAFASHPVFGNITMSERTMLEIKSLFACFLKGARL